MVLKGLIRLEKKNLQQGQGPKTFRNRDDKKKICSFTSRCKNSYLISKSFTVRLTTPNFVQPFYLVFLTGTFLPPTRRGFVSLFVRAFSPVVAFICPVAHALHHVAVQTNIMHMYVFGPHVDFFLFPFPDVRIHFA
jgi:hypothetical protein